MPNIIPWCNTWVTSICPKRWVKQQIVEWFFVVDHYVHSSFHLMLFEGDCFLTFDLFGETWETYWSGKPLELGLISTYVFLFEIWGPFKTTVPHQPTKSSKTSEITNGNRPPVLAIVLASHVWPDPEQCLTWKLTNHFLGDVFLLFMLNLFFLQWDWIFWRKMFLVYCFCVYFGANFWGRNFSWNLWDRCFQGIQFWCWRCPSQKPNCGSGPLYPMDGMFFFHHIFWKWS